MVDILVVTHHGLIVGVYCPEFWPSVGFTVPLATNFDLHSSGTSTSSGNIALMSNRVFSLILFRTYRRLQWYWICRMESLMSIALSIRLNGFFIRMVLRSRVPRTYARSPCR